ncbi:neutral zinc metallopeptidase [soil metagenome]
MRLGDERPSDNIEDRRGAGGGFGFPRGGGGFRVPMGGGGRGMSLGTIVMLVVIYFALKLIFGIDLLQMVNGGGGGMQFPQDQSSSQTTTQPSGQSASNDAGRDFVARVLGSTERVWGDLFQKAGRRYENPKLVLFSGSVQSACGMAQSAMGPFYCPGDSKVYVDLSFYDDLERKLGANGDFAQAYVVAHEVGHHVQNLLGIADKVNELRSRASETESNGLSVRMELQADCYAGVWAKNADATKNILEPGDIEEGLNAAAAIGDDRLQKKSQGYVVPESFTHGTSEQRVGWFKRGFDTGDMKSCDTFSAQL